MKVVIQQSGRAVMWFDLVLIDRLLADGTLDSMHIRSVQSQSFPVDRLEDIDATFRDIDVSDVGPIRVYGSSKIQTFSIRSKLKNFDSGDDCILMQFEHLRIPVISGYYVLLSPMGWRFAELNVYDPYNAAENAAQKRSYRGVDMIWDEVNQMSCAQFNISSIRRGTFSIGVIASLKPSGSNCQWADRSGSLEVKFTNDGHQRPDFLGFRSETDHALQKVKSEPQKMPPINISLSGPSINIVEWAKYIRDRIRKPKS